MFCPGLVFAIEQLTRLPGSLDNSPTTYLSVPMLSVTTFIARLIPRDSWTPNAGGRSAEVPSAYARLGVAYGEGADRTLLIGACT